MDETRSLAREKAVKCRIQSEAYSIWLSRLAPANFVLVVGGSLLALLAGASLLVEQGYLTKEAAGVMALISSAFTLIHNKLDCDHHQAECRRLRGIYRGMAEDYDNLRAETNPDELRRRLNALNDLRTRIIKTASAEPSKASVRKAEARIG